MAKRQMKAHTMPGAKLDRRPRVADPHGNRAERRLAKKQQKNSAITWPEQHNTQEQ